MRAVHVSVLLALGFSLGACASGPAPTGYAKANLYIPTWAERGSLGSCFRQPHVVDWLHVMEYRSLGAGQDIYPVTLCSDAVTDARNYAIEIENQRDYHRELSSLPMSSGNHSTPPTSGYAPGSEL